MLISLGYGIYDISNLPNKFSFSQIDSDYKSWGTDDYIKALGSYKARDAFNIHKEVIEYCVSCLLLLPADDSDMFLAGLVKGKGKKVFAYNNSPLVLDVNHLFLTKVLSSVEEVEKLFKKKEEYSLSKLQSDGQVKKKPRQKKAEKNGSIGKHNAKEFLQAQKEAVRTGQKHFKFEGNKIMTDHSKLIIKYLTNKGFI